MALRSGVFSLVILASVPAVTLAHDIYTGLYTKYGKAYGMG